MEDKNKKTRRKSLSIKIYEITIIYSSTIISNNRETQTL